MRVIGTAGHVDHGKSTLVKALTGIDPDRLKEEKERAMTIDLGFAWLTLPSGNIASIVDVPGHEAFIKNMLAGVGGMDAAMLVIAADEGAMPQTLEHLAILDLIQIKGGIVALTKIDAVPDREWISLISEDIHKELRDTILAPAKIIPVSAKTREGVDDLLRELDALLQTVTPRADKGKPRLAIDRVFSMAGFGTVVTGTLLDGALAVGTEIEIVPGGKRGRVRGLQTHKEKIERANPGTRVAVNLSGLRVEDLERGQLVTLPGTYAATTLIDAQLRYLDSAAKPLAHNAEVDFFVGAAESPARVRLLDKDQLKPGETGWVQLHLARAVVVDKQDRFIVRYASPSITVGGGIVIDPIATTRHRRMRAQVITRLETLARGSPEEIVVQFLARANAPLDAKQIASGTGLDNEIVTRALNSSREIFALGAGFFLAASQWHALAEKIRRALADFHQQYPLRAGMPREELKSRLGLAPRAFDQVIERAAEEKILAASQDLVRAPDFSVRFAPALETKVNALLAEIERAPYAPPSAQEIESALGAETLAALIAQEKLVRLNESVIFAPRVLQTVRAWVIATIRADGNVTAAQVRDHFNTSRKYAIALLEYLDATRVTKRVGDARVLH
ncbi:MAG: selenocysteine-specific translation elongation factor [Chloroflexi bacterium]|nr:selenocysteine-specific translation elongation factor [Chloroflexota bacterium]